MKTLKSLTLAGLGIIVSIPLTILMIGYEQALKSKENVFKHLKSIYEKAEKEAKNG